MQKLRANAEVFLLRNEVIIAFYALQLDLPPIPEEMLHHVDNLQPRVRLIDIVQV